MRDIGPDGRNGGLYGELGWRHAEGDLRPAQRVAFASDPGVTFGIAGAPIAEDALAVEAGWRVSLDERTNVVVALSRRHRRRRQRARRQPPVDRQALSAAGLTNFAASPAGIQPSKLVLGR
jgi:hypothetical protein